MIINLQKLLRYLREEKQIQEHLDQYKTEAEGLGGAGYTEGRRMHRPDKMEIATIKLSMERDKLSPRLEEIETYREQADEVFKAIGDEDIRIVLRAYYLDGKSIRQAAKAIGKSKSWVENKKQEGERWIHAYERMEKQGSV